MPRKLLLVTNQSDWTTVDQKLAEIKDRIGSRMNLTIDILVSDYKNIPFTQYKTTHEGQSGAFGVEPTWYDQNISILAKDKGYHYVAFHYLPEQAHDMASLGFRTDSTYGAIEIQICAGEKERLAHSHEEGDKFVCALLHELGHAEMMLRGLSDPIDFEIWNKTLFVFPKLWEYIPEDKNVNKQVNTALELLKLFLMGEVERLKKALAIAMGDKPKIVWKGSPNKMIGRQGYKPEAIIIHVMDGTLKGTDSWFSQSKSMVSSHYGIGKKGEIHQYVKEEDTAWHAGVVKNPTWKKAAPGMTNLITIGIEHEGTATSIWPEPMKQASATLIKDICTRWNIPIDREHIIAHSEINASKDCPGKNKAIVDELIELALKD